DTRRGLKSALEQACQDLEQSPHLADGQFTRMDLAYQQAFNLLSSPRYRQAFELQAESTATRERYGRHRQGQACLLARRLVEAGVPLITVFSGHNIRGQDKYPEQTEEYGWDTHNDIFEALREHLLP